MVHLFVVWVVSGKSLGVEKKAKKNSFMITGSNGQIIIKIHV